MNFDIWTMNFNCAVDELLSSTFVCEAMMFVTFELCRSMNFYIWTMNSDVDVRTFELHFCMWSYVDLSSTFVCEAMLFVELHFCMWSYVVCVLHLNFGACSLLAAHCPCCYLSCIPFQNSRAHIKYRHSTLINCNQKIRNVVCSLFWDNIASNSFWIGGLYRRKWTDCVESYYVFPLDPPMNWHCSLRVIPLDIALPASFSILISVNEVGKKNSKLLIAKNK